MKLSPFILMPLLSLGLCQSLAAAQVSKAQQKERLNPPGSALPPTVRVHPPVEYTRLTQDCEEWTNFNIETTRGMAVTSAGTLYAINTHGSMLLKHLDATPEPEAKWSTLHNPVALALVDAAGNEVAVLGGATHALVVHETTNGRIVRSLSLPSEPSDLVIDQARGRAYVSCMGTNEVWQINLTTMKRIRSFAIPSEAPRFLSLENEPGGTFLYVAPFLSGNNSIPIPSFPAPNSPPNLALGQIIDLDTNPNADLPDEDLFRIDVTSASPSVTAVLRGAGTLLSSHGRNPATGHHWMLGIDAKNKDPLRNSEPLLKGDFIQNQLAIASTLGGNPLPKPQIIDVDDSDPLMAGKQYSSSTSLSFPWGLAFHSNGFALATGSTSDRIVLFQSNGARVGHRDLPEGSIPRQILIDPTETLVFVYCWGSNKVQVLLWADLNAPALELDLGLDPTPEFVRKGRDLFYAAKDSLNGRSTCASCHPGGGSDGLAWPLADIPNDYKDIMVTQSLKSIEDTPPYHWRGERLLDDFNVANSGLLGKPTDLDPAPAGELDQFNAFIFSLQSAANPIQSITRTIDDSLTAITYPNGAIGQATAGQSAFLTVKSLFAQNTCVSCHAFPSGTSGDVNQDDATGIPRQANLDTAHLRQLFHRDQPEVSIQPFPPQPAFTVARTGFGLAHEGAAANIFDFLDPGAFTLTPQQRANVSSFVKQFDYGIAPASHAAFLLDQANPGGQASVSQTLVPQVGKGWIDLVAIGWVVQGAQTIDVRFLYDPASGNFTPNLAAAGTHSLSALGALASVNNASLVFLGLPAGNGLRFALDPDNDGLTDQEELNLMTQPCDRDSDDDGFSDGYEVDHGGDPLGGLTQLLDLTPPSIVSQKLDHTTAVMAKYALEFSEPVTWSVSYQTTGGPAHLSSGYVPVTKANVVLQDLEPSTFKLAGIRNDYTPTITMTDQSGNMSSALLRKVSSKDMIVLALGTAPLNERLGSLTLGPVTKTGGTLTTSLSLSVIRKAGTPKVMAPMPGRVVVAQVTVFDPMTGTWSISPNVTSTGNRLQPSYMLRDDLNPMNPPAPFTAIPGPFLFSTITDAMGNANFVNFSVSGLTQGVGMKVRLNVVDILEAVTPFNVTSPLFHNRSLRAWQMPSSPNELRAVETIF